MRTLVILASAVILTACSSPPKPPVVDGSNRQTINTHETAEVIALRARAQAAPVAVHLVPPTASRTVSVHFPYSSTRFQINANETAHLLQLLSKARRVEVRGRTDGQRPSAPDEKIALNRALAAKRYLIGQGVSPAIISVNYVSAGDYVADNYSAIGRTQNRRVDIEVFNQ